MKTEASPYQFLGSAGDFSRGTVTIDVTNALRHAIVTLALPPGTMLDKTAICTQLGVSRFPVSEALARLAEEGLVEPDVVAVGVAEDLRQVGRVRGRREVEAAAHASAEDHVRLPAGIGVRAAGRIAPCRVEAVGVAADGDRAAGHDLGAGGGRDVVADPQVRHSEMIVPVEHAKVGTISVTAPPLKMHGTPASVRRAPPLLGEHTREILGELGYDEAAVKRLAASKVVGTAR